MQANENALVHAIEALTWLIGEEEVLMPFLAQTGAGLDDLKVGAGDPEFLGAALDFILSNDEWTQNCAQAISMSPEELAPLRAKLPGGEQVHWT